jgi:hypothetical protein
MAKNDGYRRDMRLLAQRFGREVKVTGGGHLALVLPGKVPVYASCSPRNPRQALLNTERQLKLESREPAE